QLFFFPAPPTTQLSPLSLHDALPISAASPGLIFSASYTTREPSCIRRRWRSIESWLSGISTSSLSPMLRTGPSLARMVRKVWPRSEEHTSELQSLAYLVCRLLLEKKK